jgi:tetratricopeptide (TPR) repeat protein
MWQHKLVLTALALLAGALLTLISVQEDQDHPEHLSAAEWAPLALPEPTPRSRSAARPAPHLPGNSDAVQTVKASKPAMPATPVKADSGPAARVSSGEEQQAAAPVVASAALEPAAVQPSAAVRNRSPEQSAERHFAQAQLALAEQSWQRAERLLGQTLELLPAHVDARTQLAALLVARHANDAAERLLGEGLTIDSQAGALAQPYAQLLAERGALQPALEVLADVPPDAETEALRAALLHRMGNHAEAAGAYEYALLKQPDQALWWTGLAIAREHNREPREALQAYERAARLQVSGTLRQYIEQRMQALQTREDE